MFHFQPPIDFHRPFDSKTRSEQPDLAAPYCIRGQELVELFKCASLEIHRLLDINLDRMFMSDPDTVTTAKDVVCITIHVCFSHVFAYLL